MKKLFEFQVYKEKLNFFISSLDKVKVVANSNPKCQLYEYIVSGDKVLVIEDWLSEESFLEHRSSSLLQNFRQNVGSFLMAPRKEYLITPLPKG